MGGKDDDDDDLKKAFESFDTNGNGKLSFDELFALLKRGEEDFAEEEAQNLFKAADKDGSGDIDFKEFVDYLYDDKDFGDFVHGQVEEAAESEAKNKVLRRGITVRSETSKALHDAGQDWRKLSWRERLSAVEEHEAGTGDLEEEEKKEAAAKVEQQEKKEAAPKKTSAASIFAEKTQGQLVDYSIHKYDLSFAGKDPMALEELLSFREFLKVATSPIEVVDVVKYIAKGTAGWVFLVENKASGARSAMKLIRMTQALSGVREWYISKLLRNVGVSNIVFTGEQVCVIARNEAPEIIAAELRDAGPVPYYMCLMQDFMNGGTLESLVDDGRLTPKMMFKALGDVATTLSLMHESKVHHKDIKPENVLVEMHGKELTAAKLCDFGSAEIGDAAGRADDIRRFGVTLFSVATGEGWTKNRLIREKHENLIARLADAVSGSSGVLAQLPDVLQQILSGCMRMKEIAGLMSELGDSV